MTLKMTAIVFFLFFKFESKCVKFIGLTVRLKYLHFTISSNRITSFIVISRKLGNATVCVSSCRVYVISKWELLGQLISRDQVTYCI